MKLTAVNCEQYYRMTELVMSKMEVCFMSLKLILRLKLKKLSSLFKLEVHKNNMFVCFFKLTSEEVCLSYILK